MSVAAQMRMKKLAAMQGAQAQAKAEREQLEADRLLRSKQARRQPFHDLVPEPVVSVTASMVSPAAMKRQEKLARLAIEQDGAEGFAAERGADGVGASEYELLLAALGEDEAGLRQIQGTERKEAAKAGLISKYDAHVDATLAAAIDTGKAVQDEIVAMMMIWRFDVGDWDRGLDIAEHMLRHGLRLPSIKNFQRTPATIICENVAEAGLKAESTGKDFDIAVLHRAAQLTVDFDMPDQVRAKMAKATALHMLRQGELADADDEAVAAGKTVTARYLALDLLRRALELDKSSGVKKQIERVESWLKKNVIVIDDDSKGEGETPPATSDTE